MSTLDLFRPTYATSFSLSNNRHSHNSVSCYHNKLILVIVEGIRSKPDCDHYCHSRCNIACVFLGILDVCYEELLILERSYFDPLYEFGVINKSNLSFVHMRNIIFSEWQLLRLNPEFPLQVLSCGEGFSIAHGVKQMSGVFSESDFAIHPIGYFLVVYLLLDAEFGQLSWFSHGCWFLCLS